MSPGRYSRLESERRVEPRPVLETANRVNEVFRQASTPKASSSTEQATTQAEDPGAEFPENVVFMRQMLPIVAVP